MSKKVKDYTLHEEIGRGNYGVVYRATRENDPLVYACKSINKKLFKSPKESELLKQEISTHQTLHHKNIVQLYSSIETANNTYLFMEYCKDGDLQGKLNKLKKLPESEALYYLKQIMSGLKYLVDRGIMHRDIKPANFLMQEDQPKISDFGFAKQADETATSLGTPLFMAPEIIFGDEQYDNKIDIWSVGLVYYQMLFGVHPFDSMSLEQLQSKIRVHEKKGKLEFPAHIPVSEPSKDLLNKMLKVNPVNRATWDEVFSHPVFSGNQSQPIGDMMASTYRYHQAQVEKDFEANRNKQPQTPSTIAEADMDDGSIASPGSYKSINQSIAYSEAYPTAQEVHIQDNTTFAPPNLVIHPDLVLNYIKAVISHEKQVIKYIIECCKLCIKTAGQINQEAPTLPVDKVLVMNLRNSLINTCLVGVGIVRALTAKVILAFGPSRQEHNHYKLPAAKSNPHAFDGLCSVIYAQAMHDQTGLYAKILDNCLKSTINIMGSQFLAHPEVVKVYNNFFKSAQDSNASPDAQVVLFESLNELLAQFVSHVTSTTKSFFEIKQFIRGDLRKKLGSTMSFIAFSSGFLFLDQEKYKRIAQNNFKFLNPDLLTAAADGLHYHEIACFNWTEFSNKSMSVEAMTESVRQLYQGLGLQAENPNTQIRSTMFLAKNTMLPASEAHLEQTKVLSPSQTSPGNSPFDDSYGPRASAFYLGESMPANTYGYESYNHPPPQQPDEEEELF